MEDKAVPYIVYEGTIARFERVIKRLIVAIIVVVIMLFASNMMWLYMWNQYDYEDVTIDSQDGGNANYIGANGYINNGEGNSKEKN